MSKSCRVSSRKLLIIGAGGLGKEYCWVAEEMSRLARVQGRPEEAWEILGFVDEDPEKNGQVINGYPVLGDMNRISPTLVGVNLSFAVSIGNNQCREQIAVKAEQLGWTPITLVHPTAVIAADARIQEGSYLAPGAVVCPNAQLGKFVIVNTHASVGHDSELSDYVQICPGARVSGACRIGKASFVGSNASLIPESIIGSKAVVGANSLVIRRVAPGSTVLGCPAIVTSKTNQEIQPETKGDKTYG
jgi:sugar O-acyltransferase (sialic acid O-acetyltransferase NeuD family)